MPGVAWISPRSPLVSRRNEIPFLAADAEGEDVCFAGAQDILPGRVLLTGFHGDKVWSPHTTALGENLVRTDLSGLSEYRLWTGFIHCPVPFMTARQIRDIHAVSRSAEMQPWSVRGDYNRPICRRIVEGCGVPRGAFGVKKRAAAVLMSKRLHGREARGEGRGEAQGAGVLRPRPSGLVPPASSPRISRSVSRAGTLSPFVSRRNESGVRLAGAGLDRGSRPRWATGCRCWIGWARECRDSACRHASSASRSPGRWRRR